MAVDVVRIVRLALIFERKISATLGAVRGQTVRCLPRICPRSGSLSLSPGVQRECVKGGSEIFVTFMRPASHASARKIRYGASESGHGSSSMAHAVPGDDGGALGRGSDRAVAAIFRSRAPSQIGIAVRSIADIAPGATVYHNPCTRCGQHLFVSATKTASS
jgi:hypothetical protein